MKYSAGEVGQAYTPTIQKGDMLSIIVGSLSQEANEVFNAANQRSSSSMSYGSSGAPSVQPFGYLVRNDGFVELPMIGKVAVEGLETEAAADMVRTKLNRYLKEPSVIIHNLNFKVSVLGEVNRPAVYNIPNEKITLPEVLSLAGDLTIYGKRDNIMIVREENGKREYVRVDLTSRDIFNSPFYYMHKNDLVYIEPTKAKMSANNRGFQVVPIVLGIVTALSVVLFRFI
ncbi:polysaccharide biosynthesis/export family protein [Dyadobacter sp. CY351]|uniref:polysaccharide biosynthesis/export family protein n=1 Tax=Dyadobacter sp. CY351 TaxID=2909337 RepID=UPI001F157EF5|nr:polysaccharide biosynthesis/export family protein [Dyadobacter sp. CY351]MCF2519166.1 polysaccharide biosynthesis/export family protein [Dyadobacter sp. CY351]